MYSKLAEPTPVPADTAFEDKTPDPYDLQEIEYESHPLWALTKGLGKDAKRYTPRKWLHPVKFTDIYHLHKDDCKEDAVSISSLKKSWLEIGPDTSAFERLGKDNDVAFALTGTRNRHKQSPKRRKMQ